MKIPITLILKLIPVIVKAIKRVYDAKNDDGKIDAEEAIEIIKETLKDVFDVLGIGEEEE